MNNLMGTLRRKGFVEVGEHIIEYRGEWHRIEKGDRYLGQHGDQPPELLTCRRREVQRRGSGRTLGKFFPKERKDSQGETPRLYTLNEVIKVVIRDNPNYDPTSKEIKNDRTRDVFASISAAPAPTAEDRDNGIPGAVRIHDGPPAPADDRGGQREDGPRDEEGGATSGNKPVPKPPKPGPKRGAQHRDPRQPAGRTDYTAAGRKSD